MELFSEKAICLFALENKLALAQTAKASPVELMT